MAKQSKPKILVTWGDDIGITNLSCYSDGLMSYRTPNIDRKQKIVDTGQLTKKFKVHIFVYNLLPYLKGKEKLNVAFAN